MPGLLVPRDPCSDITMTSSCADFLVHEVRKRPVTSCYRNENELKNKDVTVEKFDSVREISDNSEVSEDELISNPSSNFLQNRCSNLSLKLSDNKLDSDREEDYLEHQNSVNFNISENENSRFITENALESVISMDAKHEESDSIIKLDSILKAPDSSNEYEHDNYNRSYSDPTCDLSTSDSTSPILQDCMWSQAVLNPFRAIFQELARRRGDSTGRTSSIKRLGWIWEDEKDIWKKGESRKMDSRGGVQGFGRGCFPDDSMERCWEIRREDLDSGCGWKDQRSSGGNLVMQKSNEALSNEFIDSNDDMSDDDVTPTSHHFTSGTDRVTRSQNLSTLSPLEQPWHHCNVVKQNSIDMGSNVSSSLSDVEVVQVDSETESEVEILSYDDGNSINDSDDVELMDIRQNEICRTGQEFSGIKGVNSSEGGSSAAKSGAGVVERDPNIAKFSEYVDRIHSYSCRSSYRSVEQNSLNRRSTADSNHGNVAQESSKSNHSNIAQLSTGKSSQDSYSSIRSSLENNSLKISLESEKSGMIESGRNGFSSLLRAELLKGDYRDPGIRHQRHLAKSAGSQVYYQKVAVSDSNMIDLFGKHDFSRLEYHSNGSSRVSSLSSFDEDDINNYDSDCGDVSNLLGNNGVHQHNPFGSNVEVSSRRRDSSGKKIRSQRRRERFGEEADQRRRSQHNKLERRRRNGLRALFARLEDLVRHHDKLGRKTHQMVREGGCSQRMARVHILVRAGRIARELQESNRRLELGLKCLKIKNIELRERLLNRI